MRTIPNSRRLDGHISRALNKIKKPSTAEEITELLNRDLEPEDRPFQTKEVAEWLRNAGDTALTLYLVKSSSPQVALRGCYPLIVLSCRAGCLSLCSKHSETQARK